MIKDLSSDDLHKLSTVLFNIEQLAFYAKEGDSVVFPSDEDMNRPPSPLSLSREERRFFVFAIQDEGAVKVIHEHTIGRRENPYRWTLEVNKPKLKELKLRVDELYLSGAVDISSAIISKDNNGKDKENYRGDIDSAVPSHEYFLTNSDLVESLQRQYNNLINLSEKGFFLGIADYVKFVDENSGFKEILSAIDGFRNKDKEKLVKLEGKLLDDIRKAEKTVMSRIKDAKIDSEIIKKSLDEHEMTKDGRIQSGASEAEALHGSLSHVIMSLYENGYERLISDFIKLVPDSKFIADYKISEHYYPYRDELNEYKSKIQKTIWGSWNELIVVYLNVHKYREYMDELKEKNDVIGQMNHRLLYEEMENVLGNANNDPRRLQFSKDDYAIHINRVHNFIINRLNSEPDKNAEQEGRGQDLLKRYKSLADIQTKEKDRVLQVSNVIYDISKGKLQFKEKLSIDVQPENQDVKYLALLLSANGSIVRNAEAAKLLKLNGYRDQMTDKDMSLEIQAIKKKVKALLIRCGMSSQEVDDFIRSVKGAGYKLST